MICGNVEDKLACERAPGNHPRCRAFDDDADRFVHWDNPDYRAPKTVDRATGKEKIRAAAAATGPDPRVGDQDPAPAPPEGRWSDEERELVRQALRRVCERHAGGGEFTSDEVWAELGATVRKGPGLTSVINQARHDGWLDSTGKKGRSQRARDDHDEGRELTLWYSLLPRR